MFWDTLRSDLQHTLRLAAQDAARHALTILALALGIGANSAIFAVVDSVLMKPLPYARRAIGSSTSGATPPSRAGRATRCRRRTFRTSRR